MSGLPFHEVQKLIQTFEEVRTFYFSKTDIDKKDLKKMSGLTESELKVLLTLFQKK
jgi:hypothetical protein